MIKKILVSLLILGLHFSSAHSTDNKIAVIAPIQHRAVDEIISGLKSKVENADKRVVVFNAMGDSNNLHSILSQAVQNNDYQVIMPIGKTTTSMAISVTKTKPIIGLAASVDDDDKKELIATGHTNFTTVNDEMSMDDFLNFISKIGKKTILLIYSNDDKIQKELDEMKKAATSHSIQIKTFNVSQTADFYSVGSAMKNIDAVVILKDQFVASMIDVIAEAAHSKTIPVITSDEGTVMGGADIALGIPEAETGIEGAAALHELEKGTKINEMSARILKDLKIFFKKNNILIHQDEVERISKELNYPIEFIK